MGRDKCKTQMFIKIILLLETVHPFKNQFFPSPEPLGRKPQTGVRGQSVFTHGAFRPVPVLFAFSISLSTL